MTSSIDSLRETDWRTVDLIGSALISHPGTPRIEIRQVVGWPFAWLLHPGISNGLAVADTRCLLRLQHAGLLDIVESNADDGPQFVALTRSGADVVAERAQAQLVAGPLLADIDFGDGAGWY